MEHNAVRRTQVSRGLTDGVLVHELDGLLRSEHKAVIGEVHKLLLHIKVPGELLPAHLHAKDATHGLSTPLCQFTLYMKTTFNYALVAHACTLHITACTSDYDMVALVKASDGMTVASCIHAG